jgi:hypothetical protein
MVAIEIEGREIATLVMLVGVAMLAGSDRWGRFIGFCVSFGVWDNFHYVWPWFLLGWPPSLLTWDVLFLIPVPWIGPVLAPLIVSIALVAVGLLLLHKRARGEPIRFPAPLWTLRGGLLMLGSFMLDFRAALLPLEPPFRWGLFGTGVTLGVAAPVLALRKMTPPTPGGLPPVVSDILLLAPAGVSPASLEAALPLALRAPGGAGRPHLAGSAPCSDRLLALLQVLRPGLRLRLSRAGAFAIVQLDPVASAALGPVAGGIGGLERVDRLLGPGRDRRDADARANRVGSSATPKAMSTDRPPDALDDSRCPRQPAVFQENAEFIPPETPQSVPGSQPVAHQSAQLTQQVVPRQVAAGVVHSLEPVQVEKAQGVLGLLRPRAGECAGETALEFAAVDQAGEGVMGGLMRELSRDQPRVGHVPRDHGRAGDRTAPVVDRPGRKLQRALRPS